MSSAIFELVIFSLPSLIWRRRLVRSGGSHTQALGAIGLRRGTRSDYALALALAILGTAVGSLLLGLVPSHILHGGSKNIVGAPSDAAGCTAVVLLALAEEMLFRGFLAGLLFRRFGFRSGNLLQSLIFLAPHTLLLLVSPALWPLLPLQMVAGWVLGWLRARSDSIGPCWLLHALINLMPAILLGL